MDIILSISFARQKNPIAWSQNVAKLSEDVSVIIAIGSK